MLNTAPWAFVLAALLFVGACSKNPTDSSTVNGTIVSRVTASGDYLGSLHVKENANEGCGVVWSVPKDAKLTRRVSYATTQPATFNDFVVGAKVRVTSNGIIAESCPAQGTATGIELQ